MSIRVEFKPINSVHARVRCSDDVAMEIHDRFTFDAPGYKFHPAYKAGYWDGKIRLFNLKDRTIYCGLEAKIKEYCQEQEYEWIGPSRSKPPVLTHEDVRVFAKDLGVPEEMSPRDYQCDAFCRAVANERILFLSPTASGKSLLIYLIAQWHFLNHQKKTLLIVPRTDLVEQMYGDFKSYRAAADMCHKIRAGTMKDGPQMLYISTWQSIKDMDPEWFKQFGCVLGDEVHGFTAKSLIGIMEKLTDCQYRYGFTGTLSGAKTAELNLIGLFGPVMKVTSTFKLQEHGYVSKLKINVIVLKHPQWVRELRRKKGFLKEYDDEMKYLAALPARNEFLKKLCLSREKNTLMLFRFVEKHGKILYDMMKDQGQKVYFIHGGVKGTERNEARLSIEEENGSKAVASFGVFSTGINIKNLHDIIFASAWKNRILNLQSIGRVLRLFGEDKEATVWDIVDDMSSKSGKNKINFSLRHGQERLRLYEEERFEYSVHEVRLDYDMKGRGDIVDA